MYRFFFAVAQDDGSPCQGVQSVNDEPNPDDGHQPIACVADVLPEFDEADIERQQHHHDSGNAQKEEQIVQSLFSPLHPVKRWGLQTLSDFLAEVLVTAVDIEIEQSHAHNLP